MSVGTALIGRASSPLNRALPLVRGDLIDQEIGRGR
jgi:hypothetical protein